MLADCDRLFDEVPEVLWDGRCQSYPQTKGIFQIEVYNRHAIKEQSNSV
jgi:hypothetical protein